MPCRSHEVRNQCRRGIRSPPQISPRSSCLTLKITCVSIPILTSISYEISADCDLYAVPVEFYVFIETALEELVAAREANDNRSEIASNFFSFDSNDDNLSAPKPAEAESGIKDNPFFCDSDDDDDVKRGCVEGESGIKDDLYSFENAFGDSNNDGSSPSTASNARPFTLFSFSFEAANRGTPQKRRYDPRGLLLGT